MVFLICGSATPPVATGWFTEVGGTDNTIDKLRDSMVQ
jgi:hypothetical protein